MSTIRIEMVLQASVDPFCPFLFFVRIGSSVGNLCRYETKFSFILLVFVLFILTQTDRNINFVVIVFNRQDLRCWRILGIVYNNVFSSY